MATLFEKNNASPTSYDEFMGTKWWAQTFTPALAHKIMSVKCRWHRYGNAATIGTITVSIKATDGDGKPTGSDLCLGTIAASAIATTPGDWYEVTLGAGAILTAGTKYAIVERSSGGDSDNFIKIYSASAYAGGTSSLSNDSGATWANQVPDLAFEDWGEADAPTVTTQATSHITRDKAQGNGNVTGLGSSAVTQHGHCWSTSANPTTADSKTTLGAKAAIGAFTSNIIGLTANTLYHTRAYATNSYGTSYGADVSFTTVAVGGGIYGNIAIYETRIHYRDAYGVERWLEGTPI